MAKTSKPKRGKAVLVFRCPRCGGSAPVVDSKMDGRRNYTVRVCKCDDCKETHLRVDFPRDDRKKPMVLVG